MERDEPCRHISPGAADGDTAWVAHLPPISSLVIIPLPYRFILLLHPLLLCSPSFPLSSPSGTLPSSFSFASFRLGITLLFPVIIRFSSFTIHFSCLKLHLSLLAVPYSHLALASLHSPYASLVFNSTSLSSPSCACPTPSASLNTTFAPLPLLSAFLFHPPLLSLTLRLSSSRSTPLTSPFASLPLLSASIPYTSASVHSRSAYHHSHPFGFPHYSLSPPLP